MTGLVTNKNVAAAPPSDAADHTVEENFHEALRTLHASADRFFAKLMLVQWAACVVLAQIVSPLTWAGTDASVHPHVWAALLLGGAIALYPAYCGFRRPGETVTRYALALAQILMSALLIHLTGGRIETHFHVFGSLAFLAFYRDVRVLLAATALVAVDHLLRGIFWPESVYGVFVASPWRTVEHAFWVLFEVAFLSAAIRRSLVEMRQVAERQTTLEDLNEEMEVEVRVSTAQLRETEERYRTLFEEAPVGLFQASLDGEILVANRAMLDLMGFSSTEEMRAGQAVLHGGASHDEELKALLLRVKTKDRVSGQDVTWHRQDGSVVRVQETLKAVRGTDGKILSIEGTAEDITQRRELEERYLQAQKVQAIGQLAGGVAHDFNNILTAIIGYSDLLIDKGGLQSVQRAQAHEIKRASERAASLTQQLLAFSRKQTLLPRVLQLNAVVSEMDQMLRRLVGEHIQVQTKLASDLAAVKADPGQVQQVVMNLVVNARDAMPEGGKLTIETANVTLDEDYCRLHPEAVLGDYVLLAVSDNGIGMSPEVRARIFEPFFTTKGVGTGTGLGLATCHGIVKQSGGSISVYSELGMGTTFRAYFPTTREAVAETASGERSFTLIEGTETILLVEDEPMVRELGVLALSSLGYRVIEASNGVEALKRLEKLGADAIALLVTDVVMPEMGGRELARHARALHPSMRILFSSGYTYDAIGRADLLEQGTFFLPKPYTMAMLAEKIREVLESTPATAPAHAQVPAGPAANGSREMAESVA
jgi:PAS domain S-box-containing protein